MNWPVLRDALYSEFTVFTHEGMELKKKTKIAPTWWSRQRLSVSVSGRVLMMWWGEKWSFPVMLHAANCESANRSSVTDWRRPDNNVSLLYCARSIIHITLMAQTLDAPTPRFYRLLPVNLWRLLTRTSSWDKSVLTRCLRWRKVCAYGRSVPTISHVNLYPR